MKLLWIELKDSDSYWKYWFWYELKYFLRIGAREKIRMFYKTYIRNYLR